MCVLLLFFQKKSRRFAPHSFAHAFSSSSSSCSYSSLSFCLLFTFFLFSLVVCSSSSSSSYKYTLAFSSFSFESSLLIHSIGQRRSFSKSLLSFRFQSIGGDKWIRLSCHRQIVLCCPVCRHFRLATTNPVVNEFSLLHGRRQKVFLVLGWLAK